MPQISKALIQRICEKNDVSGLTIEGINSFYRAEIFREATELHQHSTLNSGVPIVLKPVLSQFYQAIYIISQQMQVLEIKNLEKYFVEMIKKIIQSNPQHITSQLIIYEQGTGEKIEYLFTSPTNVKIRKRIESSDDLRKATTTKKIKFKLGNIDGKSSVTSVTDVTDMSDITLTRSISSSENSTQSSPPQLESSSPMCSDSDDDDLLLALKNKIAIAEACVKSCREELEKADKDSVIKHIAELQLSHRVVSPVTLFASKEPKRISKSLQKGGESLEVIKRADRLAKIEKNSIRKSPLSHESKSSTAVIQAACIPVLLKSKSRSSKEIRDYKKALFDCSDYVRECEENLVAAEDALLKLNTELQELINAPAFLISDSFSFHCDEEFPSNTSVIDLRYSMREKNQSILSIDMSDDTSTFRV